MAFIPLSLRLVVVGMMEMPLVTFPVSVITLAMEVMIIVLSMVSSVVVGVLLFVTMALRPLAVEVELVVFEVLIMLRIVIVMKGVITVVVPSLVVDVFMALRLVVISVVLVMTIVLERVSLVMEVVKVVIITVEGLLLKMLLVVVGETLTSVLLEVDIHVTKKHEVSGSGNNTISYMLLNSLSGVRVTGPTSGLGR